MIEQIPKIYRNEVNTFEMRRDVENIWGILDNWADTVNGLSDEKIMKIYKAAVEAGLIKENIND